jgi:hypothetical protein
VRSGRKLAAFQRLAAASFRPPGRSVRVQFNELDETEKIGASEARTRLSELLARVSRGQVYVIRFRRYGVKVV